MALTEITGFRIAPVQEQIWSEQKGSACFRTACAVRVHFPITVDRLAQAAAQLVDRYEILRTRYHVGDGRRFPLQVVLDHGSAVIEEGEGNGLLPLVGQGIDAVTSESSPPLRIHLNAIGGDESQIILSLPTMAGDSRTLLLLAGELVAALRGEETEEEEVLQYTQYAEWSRQFAEEPDEEAVAFWRATLQRSVGTAELSWHRNADHPAVAALPVPLGAKSVALNALAENLSISVGDLITGLWGGFLLRIGRGTTIEIGCDLHGREFEELAGVVGPIARTVPLVVEGDNEANVSATTFLQNAGKQLEELRDASDYYPFDGMEERKNRSASIEIVEEPSADDFTLEWVRSVRNHSTVKLSCTVGRNGALSAELLYDTSLLTVDSAATIGVMFASFVRNVLDNPERPLQSYPLLNPTQLEGLHWTWNMSAERGEEKNEDILALIERKASEHPHAVAVTEGEKEFTYADLMRRADAVAQTLQSHGIGRGQIVPFSLERSFDAVAVILGVMKVGAAFLPLDPALPEARRRFMVQDSGANVVVTTEELRNGLGDDLPTILLSAIGSEHSTSVPPVAADPDDAAYVIYTSGSTGTPKGCIIRRRNIAAYVGWALGYYFTESAAEGHWPLFTSLSFDLTLTSIFCALAHGGSVTIFGEGKEMPEILREMFSPETRIDIVKMTPAQASLLGSTGLKKTNVRGVILGGEQLQQGQVAALCRLNPEIAIFNEYGPTETTIGCVTAKIAEGDKRITIGKPIAGAAVYIADQTGELCAPYEAGELWIAGTGVGAGYLNRPELTTQRFRDDLPFTNGGTAYKTGDIVRRYPDGQIEYIGRNDDQVKVRGYRVELGEIRGALLKLEGVADGIVLAQSGEKGKEESSVESDLVAWYVPARDVSAEQIREGLQRVLPDYMVPQFLVPIEGIPLTVNGKPDTAALPDPRTLQGKGEYTAPRTETERLIAEVWKEILGSERVGIHDDFFALGGHSLRAMRGIAQVNMGLGIELKVGAIFEHPTVAQLAELAEEQRNAGKNSTPAERIERVQERDYYELSDAQRRLWVLEQMEDLGDTYHVAGAYDVRGEFDAEAFRAAFTGLVERHEILRTTFPVVGGTPMQRVHNEVTASIEIVDLQNENDPEAAAQNYVQSVVAAPFDLEAGPLIRAAILKHAPLHHRLIVWMHHIISDGWSVAVMIKELVALYRAHTENRVPDLSPLPIQYRDFADYQSRQLNDGALAESREYWLEKLAGATPLDLPLDMPRPGRKSYRGNVETFTFDTETLAGLEKIASENGGSLFMVLLGLFNALLHRYTGQDDITVGTAIAGRNRAELEDQIGFYVNVLPLRSTVRGDRTFAELLADMRQTATDAYTHQSYPFDRLVDELGVERETGRSPLFDIFLVLQNNERQELRFGDAVLAEHPLSSTPNKYDLSFDFIEDAEGLHCEVNYNSDVFLPERIRNLIAHLTTLTQAVLTDKAKDMPISALPIITNDELEAITTKEGTAQELRTFVDRTIPDLVDEIARRHPEHKAAIYDGQSIGYDSLRKHSNGIAGLLRAQLDGKGKENNRTAILLPRSERIPLIFLSILKAGGTYVPIDPYYPTERIERMLKDCDASLLITDAEGMKRLGDVDASVSLLSIDELLKAEEREESPFQDGTPEDVAAILYTSGSTGQPKGVMMHHRGLINAGRYTINGETPLSSASTIVQFASLSFDASLCEMLAALVHGATLVVVPRQIIDDPKVFADFIAQNGVTSAALPPAYLATLNNHPLTPLQTIVTAGEPPVLDDALFYAGTRTYVNAYGPTECSICVTRHEVDVEGDYRQGIPIGTELPNFHVLLLDRYGNPLPAGFDGEICVVGKGVGPGYLDEAQTRASFIEHPLFPGERMYRTGDLGRRLFNGEILFRGRLDNQVKVRGHRVEPEEIASALREHSALSDAAVIAQKSAGQSARLVAWVVPAASAVSSPSMVEIRSWLTERLPAYMIPSFFFAVDELPTTPNGKVDRATLLAQAEERINSQELAAQGREPITEEEQVLTEAVAEVLGLAKVSPDDNYFMLGGDSIKAIRLTWGLRERGYTLQVRDIFAHPLLADAATCLRKEEGKIEEGKVEGEVPLTPIQYWFFAHFTTEGKNRFNQSVLLKKEAGRIDEEKVRVAIALLLERHDMLRASFDTDTEPPRQNLAADVDAVVTLRDLIEMNEPEIAFKEELVRTHTSIHIAIPSLLKATVIRTDDADYLHLAAHHLVVDVVSWHILVEDLTTAYRALEEGKESEAIASLLPPRTASYRRWSERLQALTGTEELEKAAHYWGTIAIHAVETKGLPVNDDVPNIYRDAVSLNVALDEEKTGQLLADVHNAYNTEVRDIVTAALGAALRKETNGRTALLALEGHGRSVQEMSDTDVSRTVGWFTALYPVLLQDGDDHGQNIKQAKEALRSLPMEGASYGICRYLNPQENVIPDLLSGPTQIVLNYLGIEGENAKGNLFAVVQEPEGIGFAPEEKRPFEIEIIAGVRNGKFEATLTWNEERIKRGTVEAIAEEWLAQIGAMIQHALAVDAPQLTPSDIDYDGLSIDDLDDLLSSISGE